MIQLFQSSTNFVYLLKMSYSGCPLIYDVNWSMTQFNKIAPWATESSFIQLRVHVLYETCCNNANLLLVSMAFGK